MSIQDLIQLINTQLPDNNQQLITEAILRGVLGDMVDTLSSELRVFNIESSQVTDNQDSTYSITGVENALVNAIAIDEKLNIFQFNGTNWVAKVVDIILSATGDDGVEIDNSDPNSIVVKLTQATLDSLALADSAVQPGDNADLVIPEYATDEDADNDTGLEENYPYSVEGERTIKTKINSGSIQELYKYNRFNDRYTALYGLNHSKIYEKESLNPLPISREDYNSLNEYEDRYYIVDKEGVYYAGTTISKEVWTYEPGDMHVSKSGNDTTGDGTFANPYLTINKAITEAALTGGFTIWVGEGEYIEDSGSGYLLINNKMFVADVVVKSRLGERVVIKASSGDYCIRIQGDVDNIFFEGMWIETIPTTTTTIYIGLSTSNVNNVGWRECTIIDNNNAQYLIRSLPASTGQQSGINLKRCIINSPGEISIQRCDGINIVGCVLNGQSPGISIHTSNYGVININNNYINSSSSGVNASRLGSFSTIFRVNRNTIIAGVDGILIKGGSIGIDATIYASNNNIISGSRGLAVESYAIGGLIEKNKILSSGTVGIGVPTDGSPVIETVQNMVVRHNHVTMTTSPGHGILIAVNSYNIEVYGNIVICEGTASYAFILKGDSNEVRDNVFIGGTNHAIYLKGAENSIVKHNIVLQNMGGSGIGTAIEDSIQTNNCVVRFNLLNIESGSVYNVSIIGPDNVFNYNEFIAGASATWGIVGGVTVNSLDEVKQAWLNSYGAPNDNKSIQLRELP